MNNNLPSRRWAAAATGLALAVGTTWAVFGSEVELSQLDPTRGLKLRGGSGPDELAYAVSSAGDINDDGFGDFVVGAPEAAPNGSSSGMAYVVFGDAAGLSGTLDLTALDGSDGFLVQGAAQFDYAGFSVDSAGDINGDGIDDLLLAASSSSISADFGGAVYVIFGDDSPFSSPLDLSQAGNYAVISSGEADAEFGWSVSGAGDFNGDTIADFVVGAPSANGYSGAAYVIFGSDVALPGTPGALNGTNGFAMAPLGSGDSLGYSVAGGGDINGDGLGDVIIGAPDAGVEDAYNGDAYIVFGSDQAFGASFDLSSLDGDNGFLVKGALNGDGFGTAVRFAGDVNGDDIDDLVIGAPTAGVENANSGTSYVIFGRDTGFEAEVLLSGLDGTYGFAVEGEVAGDQSGSSVGGTIDLNFDGVDDLVIGAQLADPNGSESGSSYVVFGKASGWSATMALADLDGSNGYKVNGITAGDKSGWSVNTAGDINQDGWNDLLIGSPMANATGTDSGEAYVLFSVLMFDPDVIFSDGFEE